MAKTQVRSPQIEDQGVRRADLNTSTTGSAVITKVVQGSGILISSTGVDSGTGDVTVSAPFASADLEILARLNLAVLQ